MATKIDVVAELRRMLKDVFAASAAGAPPARFGRAHGYVDGYMRALLDAGLATRDQLLAVVTLERGLAREAPSASASLPEKSDENAAA